MHMYRYVHTSLHVCAQANLLVHTHVYTPCTRRTLHSHVCTVHMHIEAHTHIHMQRQENTLMDTYVHTHIHTHLYMHRHTFTQAYTSCAHRVTCTHKYTHTGTGMYIHLHACVRTNTHTYTEKHWQCTDAMGSWGPCVPSARSHPSIPHPKDPFRQVGVEWVLWQTQHPSNMRQEPTGPTCHSLPPQCSCAPNTCNLYWLRQAGSCWLQAGEQVLYCL